MIRLHRLFGVGVLAVSVGVLSGCGGAAASPTSPTSSTVSATGTWVDGQATWRLVQDGSTVTGTTEFINDSNAVLGTYSGRGVVLGTMSGSSLTFADTYTSLTVPNCREDVTGTATVGPVTITGGYTQIDTCGGQVVFTLSGRFTMSKQ